MVLALDELVAVQDQRHDGGLLSKYCIAYKGRDESMVKGSAHAVLEADYRCTFFFLSKLR